MIVLDSSALLAFLRRERGAEIVVPHLRESMLSAVNLAEVLSKAVEWDMDAAAIHRDIRALGIAIIPFDEEQALHAALLRRITAPQGLSLGDRVCLALAAINDCAALTAERQWAALPHGVTIELVR